MRAKILAIFLLAIAPSSFAKSKLCQFQKMTLKTNAGESSFHEALVSHLTIKVGGAEDTVLPNIDRLAVQRDLLACADEVAKCFEGQAKILPAEMMITFRLTPSKEKAVASNFSFEWKTSKEPKIEKCLSKAWTGAQFGLVLSRQTTLRIPMNIATDSTAQTGESSSRH